MLTTISRVSLLLMIIAMAGLLVSHSLVSPSPIAIGLQCLAFLLMFWARATFGSRSFHAAADPTSGGLVTTGPYHFIRHPIYAAACLFGWAGAVQSGSALALSLGLLLFAGALGRILCEERLLIRMYPEYEAYAHVTKRLVPYVF
jgi:protein-S-isoprenylcysteine O-methyltransferase Ste14